MFWNVYTLLIMVIELWKSILVFTFQMINRNWCAAALAQLQCFFGTQYILPDCSRFLRKSPICQIILSDGITESGLPEYLIYRANFREWNFFHRCKIGEISLMLFLGQIRFWFFFRVLNRVLNRFGQIKPVLKTSLIDRARPIRGMGTRRVAFSDLIGYFLRKMGFSLFCTLKKYKIDKSMRALLR